MKTTVIHHSADYDGLFCREIARKFLPHAELIGWDFPDKPLPTSILDESDTIYILDLPVDRIFGDNFTENKVSGKGFLYNKVVWIDHHKSSIETHPPDFAGYRIDGVAACRLAWQWFAKECNEFPLNAGREGQNQLPTLQQFIGRTVSEPMAVRLAGEYDIWDRRDPRAELFQHGLRSEELTDYLWAQLLDNTVPYALKGTGTQATNSELACAPLLNAGRSLQYAQTKQNESIIKALGFTVQFEGLTFLACNHARYNSHLFTAGLRPEHDACFGFKWAKDHWEVSLYHAPGKEHHDLSQIAVKYGGGGHRGACGFRSEKLPFIEI